jgi:hypothetical protein
MRQWLRKCTLLITQNNGDAIDVSELRIVFDIKKSDAQSPNTANIKVYNLSEDTATQIQKEFSEVVLQAGYEENFGVIFRGNTKQISRGRENGTDAFLEIMAADGDAAYNFAIVNTTLAAGASRNTAINAAKAPMGLQDGYIPDFGGERLPRGKVMYGMSRDYLRQAGTTTDSRWSIQDGRVQFVENTGTLPNTAVLLTSASGLIDTPEQTTEGIKIKCLINPQIKAGGTVSIANSEVNAIKNGADKDGEGKKKEPVAIAADGVYRVLSIGYAGDTRGQNWYQELACVGVDESAPAGKKVKGK